MFFPRRKAAWCFSASLPTLSLMLPRNLLSRQSRFSSTNYYRHCLHQLFNQLIFFRSLRKLNLKQREKSWQGRKLLLASTCSSARFFLSFFECLTLSLLRQSSSIINCTYLITLLIIQLHGCFITI